MKSACFVSAPALCAVLVSVSLASAQAPADGEASAVRKFKVHAAATPEPALRFVLMPPATRQKPGNAALFYLGGVQLADSLKKEDVEKVSKWLDTPLSELPKDEVGAMVRESSLLTQVETAATRVRCVWESTVREHGFMALLPGRVEVRTLAKLLALRIRLEIAERRFDDAVESLQLGFAMARHLQEGETLIEGLIGIAIANIMLDRIDEFIRQPGSPNLYWALTDLPSPLVSMRNGLMVEREALEMTWPDIHRIEGEPMAAEQWKTFLREGIAKMFVGLGEERSRESAALLVALSTKYYPTARQHLIDRGRPAKAVDDMPVTQVTMIYLLHRYRYWRDEIHKWSNVPVRQQIEGLAKTEDAFTKAVAEQDGWPFNMVLPALSAAMRSQHVLGRRVAALRTVEAIRLHAAANDQQLPGSLAMIKGTPTPIDPVTGKPFEYHLVDGVATVAGPTPKNWRASGVIQYQIVIEKKRNNQK